MGNLTRLLIALVVFCLVVAMPLFGGGDFGGGGIGGGGIGGAGIGGAGIAVAEPMTRSSKAELAEAHRLYSEEKFPEAINCYKKLVEQFRGTKDRSNTLAALQGLGDSYLRAEQIPEARSAFEDIRCMLPGDRAVNDRATNLRDIAATYFAEGKFAAAQALCFSALTLQETDKDVPIMDRSKSAARLGYCFYKQANYKNAAQYLTAATDLFERDPDKSISANEFRRRVYHIAGGCHYHIRDYRQATHVFTKLRDLNEEMFGPTDVRTGWALLALSDAEDHIGHHDNARENFRRAIWIFRKWNFDKLAKQYDVHEPGMDQTETPAVAGMSKYARLLWFVFGNQSAVPAGRAGASQAPKLVQVENDLIASNIAHDPWEALRSPTPDAPGLVWADPTVPRKGIVICVHGLSLHHGAYEDFARRIAPSGYTVIAFDVRGFGSYNQAYGAEEVDFDACVSDLLAVIEAIREDNPGTPIFLLGESMGGAISLRVAAKHEHLIDGLIASVPAGKRFEETGLKLQVAKKLLHANRPFDIGTRVVRQATTDPDLKARWGDDPMVRLNMSPKELLRFQKLCKRNIESASKIKSIPVIVFQGLNDKLIRPEGTLQVFHALSTPDKDMMVLGNSEHLIFEEGQCPDDVLQGVVAWMNSRLTSEIRKKPPHP